MSTSQKIENSIQNGAFHVHAHENGTESIEMTHSDVAFLEEYTDDYGEKINALPEPHLLNSREATQEMAQCLQSLQPVDLLQVEHWLDREIPLTETGGLSFVGTGIESRAGIKLDIGLSRDLRKHIQNQHWRNNTISLVVGEYREPMFGNSHWVAINNGIWPAPDITNSTAKGVWIVRRNRFAFTLTRDFVVEHRRNTRRGNQKLSLLITFGRGPVAGNTIWINPA